MKVVALLTMFGLGVLALPAQEKPASPGPSDVTVISTAWHKETRNPELSADPTVANQRSSSQKDSEQGSNHLPVNRLLVPDSLKDPKTQGSNDPAVQYVYELRLLNNGSRTIRRLVWDFDLLEPDTGHQVGHHTFTSVKTIQPGKSTKLVERSTLNPVSVVDARNAGAQAAPKYSTRVTITRIEYEQGDPWLIRTNTGKEVPK